MKKDKIASYNFSSVYPLYLAKAERKNRTKDEVDEIICWLTGYSREGLESQIEKGVDLAAFFAEAPAPNPARQLIKGVVCGVRVEEVEIRFCGKSVIWTSLWMNWPKGKVWIRLCGKIHKCRKKARRRKRRACFFPKVLL